MFSSTGLKSYFVQKPTTPKHFAKNITISKYKTIVYCWIPSHTGIRNNERVDKKAKESLNLEQTVFKIPFNNFKPFINRYIFDKWQTSWNETPFNKLKEIKPVIKDSKTVISNIRREEVVLTRLRIGQTRITHSVAFEPRQTTHLYWMRRSIHSQALPVGVL